MKIRRASEEGMILINVLLFIAIASAAVALMISTQDIARERTVMLGEAARAEAAARGGELSAIVALRRDAVSAPQSDYPGEAWGKVAQRNVAIAGGSFDLAIADAQARFNINALTQDDPAAIDALARIAASLRLPPDAALRAAALIRAAGPIEDLSPLRFAGLDPTTATRLAQFVTALPGPTTVNLNTASESLLAILLDSPAKAHMLVAIRDRRGVLGPDDFAAAQIGIPAGAGFTSDYYLVRTRVRIGDTSQQLTSLLARRREGTGVAVVAIARWKGNQGPALPGDG